MRNFNFKITIFILPIIICTFILGGFVFTTFANESVDAIIEMEEEEREKEREEEYDDPIIIEVPTEVQEVPVNEESEKEEANEVPDPNPVTVPEITCQSFSIPSYPGMKKWMGYKLFGKSTRQYALQRYAITNEKGFRMIGNRYIVALGTHFGAQIGQCFDLVLENGTVIPCVLGDVKAPQHTDASNIFSNTNRNLCASEFIVDTKLLNAEAKHRGDASFAYAEWQSPVVTIHLYSINLLA